MRWPALRADRFVLGASLAFGTALVVVTPPFQVPDEPAHFFRAYSLSEGHLGATIHDGKWGASLPVSLRTLMRSISDVIAADPEKKVAAATIFDAFGLELEAGRRDFLEFPTSALYTPVPYVPQALAIAAGRLLGAPPLLLFYLARWANLLAASLVIYLAVRQLPAFRWIFVALALTPMATFLRGSMSADALTTAAAFLLAATVGKLAWGPGETMGPRDVALLVLSSAALCLSKPAYVPLALAPLVIPGRAFPRGKRVLVLASLFTVTALAFVVAAMVALAVESPLNPDARVDSELQVRAALAEPCRLVHVVADDYVRHAPRYAAEFIGRLGWLDVPLPLFLLMSYSALMAVLLFFDTGPEIRIAGGQRTLLLGIVVVTLLVVSASQYALWTPYRADYVVGLQGRYFHPIAPLAVWIGHARWRAGRMDPRLTGWLAATLCSASLLGTLVVLAWCYYG